MLAEKDRVLKENARRAIAVDPGRYQVTDPAEFFLRVERQRAAVELLRQSGRFPTSGAAFLEVGCGTGGWLGDFSGWGAAGKKLHGVDLDFGRVRQASRRFPASCLAVSDGAALPWADRSFEIVVLSTVLSSVLDEGHRRAICSEIVRVLDPRGSIVVHDFRVRNPSNPAVMAIRPSILDELFPGLERQSRSVGLAPPLLRRVVNRSWWAAQTLALLPGLRTHWVAVLSHPSIAAHSGD